MRLILYSEPRAESLRISEISGYLEETFPGCETVLKEGLPWEGLKGAALAAFARELAEIRVLDPFKPFQFNEPMHGEVRFEERALQGQASPSGVLYDGYLLQELYLSQVPPDQRGFKFLSIFFTERFFGTYDRKDLRYHGRVIVLGNPTIISTTGLVEAPAKPREFYVARGLGGGEKVKDMLAGRFIDYEDERMTEVLKGYAAQGVFYHLTGEAFCGCRECRLFNAHWQEEVVRAQLSEPEFCTRHRRVLSDLKGLPDP